MDYAAQVEQLVADGRARGYGWRTALERAAMQLPAETAAYLQDWERACEAAAQKRSRARFAKAPVIGDRAPERATDAAARLRFSADDLRLSKSDLSFSDWSADGRQIRSAERL